jgi:WD40 repeat protein
LGGGIGIIEMMYKTNIFGLVGGGQNPKYTPNKVILWDDYQTKVLNEFKLTSSVKNLKLKKDKIIIVCEQRIYIYSTDKYKLTETIETFKNEVGAIGINTDQNFTVMGYPIHPEGFIKVKFYEKSQEVDINAHDSVIHCISINSDGTLVATASNKGQIIRLFCISNGQFIEEFRRGKDKAFISCVAFDEYSSWMGICSERGVVHIFSMGNAWNIVKEKGEERTKIPPNEEELPKNQTSFFRKLPNFLTGGAFDGDKSFAKVRIESQNAICAIFPDHNIIVITSSGKFYHAKLDVKKGGTCQIIKTEDLNQKPKK